MENFKSKALAFFAAITISSVSISAPDIQYLGKLSDSDKSRVDKAYRLVKLICPSFIAGDGEDIESAKGGIYPDWNQSCMSMRCDKFGWKNSVYLQIKLSNDPKHIPTKLRAWGHTEHIYVNIDEGTPGMTVAKFPQLCGSQPDPSGVDTFIRM